jgi:CRISPR-associated protein Cas5d
MNKERKNNMDNVYTMDETERKFCVEFTGRKAMFTTPVSKYSIEKQSYCVPTYQALVGMIEALYWKPTFNIVIDKVRIINHIDYETAGIKIMKGSMHVLEQYDLCHYKYLSNVRYRVLFHIAWDKDRDDMIQDRNAIKHWNIMMRSAKRGGRHSIHLGCSECPANVEYLRPEEFDSGVGYYDNFDDITFDNMFHSFDYQTGLKTPRGYFVWNAKMHKGVIDFWHDKADELRFYNYNFSKKDLIAYDMHSRVKPVDEEFESIGGEE